MSPSANVVRYAHGGAIQDSFAAPRVVAMAQAGPTSLAILTDDAVFRYDLEPERIEAPW